MLTIFEHESAQTYTHSTYIQVLQQHMLNVFILYEPLTFYSLLLIAFYVLLFEINGVLIIFIFCF